MQSQTHLQPQDLKTFAHIGASLWTDMGRSYRATADTLGAISLQHLTPERTLEKAAASLLARAIAEGMAANVKANFGMIAHPFYRLLPEQRMLLVSLHQGRWSYARLGRILGQTPQQIEEAAWKTRLELIATVQTDKKYAVGAPQRGPNCPEYDSARPWTQRFLDEEIHSKQELLFLQNHLHACDSCRRALIHCRNVYFAIDAVLPKISNVDTLVENLQVVHRKSNKFKNPMEMTFLESLEAFASRNRGTLYSCAAFLFVLWLMS